LTFVNSGLVLLCISLIVAGAATAQDISQSSNPRFAVRVIDESMDGRTQTGPPGENRVPNSTLGIGMPGWWWLKREGGIEGSIAEAHVGAAADGRPTVGLTFTPEGREKFAALTHASLGHRLAFVVNGTVIAAQIVGAEITEGKVMITGYYTEMEARTLVDEIMGAARPAAR
jgi:preprotein translocase subunit SecD